MKTITIFFLLIGLYSTSYGNIDPFTIGYTLSEFKSTTTDIAEEYKNSANAVIHNAAQNILISIRTFEDVYANILEKTFDEINESQQKAYNKLISLIDNFDLLIEKTDEKIIHQVNNLANHVSHLIISSKIPRLSKVYLPLIVNDDNNESIELVFQGVRLENNKTHLMLFNQKFYPSHTEDLIVKFRVPKKVFLNSITTNEITFIDAELHIAFKKRWSILNSYKEYSLELKVVPNEIASVVIDYDINRKIEKRRKREIGPDPSKGNLKTICSGRFRFPSGYQRGKGNVPYSIPVSPGWQFNTDIVSIRHETRTESCHSGNFGSSIVSKSKDLININVKCETNRCDCNCRIWTYVTAEEFKYVDNVLTESIDKKIITYNSPTVIDLPKDSNFRIAKVILNNGKEIVFTRDDKRFGIYFTIDENKNQIIIKAIS